jgi:hypothetical protein
MTKQILIPSVLLMAAGCSTQSASLDGYGLDDVNAQSMGEEALPGLHGEALDALIDQIVTAVTADKAQKDLFRSVYAHPVESNEEGLALSESCGINPELLSIQILDSDCQDINFQWGWEVEVENCEIDGEIYDGMMQFSYDELRYVPGVLPMEVVIAEAQHALSANLAGFSSARYALSLESADSSLDACGEESGPAQFRFSETETHRLSFAENSMEALRNNGVSHEMAGSIGADEMRTISNGDGDYEITLEDGDRTLVVYQVRETNTLDGDQWPSEGRIEAHVEGVGSLVLLFTSQSPVDGTVKVLTPFKTERVNLPME